MLDKAYDLNSAEATQEFYNTWAKTYDTEIEANGYKTPSRCARALKKAATDTSGPILDVGCGSGISGQALVNAGFNLIDGCDFSSEMLAVARSKSIYRNLYNTDLADPFPFEDGQYKHITAMGVLNPGHAPAETLDQIMELLQPGGLFVFSLNDHALEDKTYEARINEHVDCGTALLLARDYGDHLPKIGLKSNVYVLEKL